MTIRLFYFFIPIYSSPPTLLELYTSKNYNEQNCESDPIYRITLFLDFRTNANNVVFSYSQGYLKSVGGGMHRFSLYDLSECQTLTSDTYTLADR